MAIAAMLAASVSAQVQAPDLDALLTDVGERVRQFYARAVSLVCTEKVTIQPVGHNMMPEGFGRSLEYELRVAWEKPNDGDKPEATVLRQLKRINGREARPGAEPQCLDPRAVSPEPLALLLPSNREDYVFSVTGACRDRNRAALILAYKSRVEGKPTVTTKDDCTNVDLPGWTKGRLWLDPATHDVLRFEESLTKRFVTAGRLVK